MVRILTIVLLTLTGISAIFGGGALIADRTGESIGFSVEILQHSPFKDFFIPGHILFLVLGVGSLVACVMVIIKMKGYDKLTLFIGFALAIWIAIQVFMLQDVNFLQIIYGFIGILLIILGILERNKIFKRSS